jgi:quinoprotein relay system zinc metallohydrolase 2
VAPGIHVRHGLHEEASAANADAIANIGFIVGDAAVAVIDPGGSRADGEALRARIREVTDRPVRYVVLTHFHPDHVFGAGAFLPDAPQFVAHAALPASAAARGEFYRRNLEALLGPGAGDFVPPGRLVEGTATIDLGDRPLLLRAHRTAHTDNDLSVFDPRTATLWAGDLLFVERVPALDGSLLGWLAELAALRELPARRAVPGHGPVSVPWPEGADDEERYLRSLLREVRAVLAAGGDIETAVAGAGASEHGRWALFDEYHGRNVTTAFKELEWE